MRRIRKGIFTLIELLVVIAIISILSAMLLPALSNARKNVRVMICLNQQHQFNIACMTYAGDCNELPTAQLIGSWNQANGGYDGGQVHKLFNNGYIKDKLYGMCTQVRDKTNGAYDGWRLHYSQWEFGYNVGNIIYFPYQYFGPRDFYALNGDPMTTGGVGYRYWDDTMTRSQTISVKLWEERNATATKDTNGHYFLTSVQSKNGSVLLAACADPKMMDNGWNEVGLFGHNNVMTAVAGSWLPTGKEWRNAVRLDGSAFTIRR